MVVDYHSNSSHSDTVFCPRAGGPGATGPHTLPPRDGPIVPSNCKTHLTCQPVHPNRSDASSWFSSATDWLTTAVLAIGGSVVVFGACIYGKSVIDKNRKKKRDQRLASDGRRPPSEGASSDEEDDDLRGQRG